VVGDVVRVGRRGSLNGQLEVTGVMGHVAYPELARNPIHDALGVLQQLTQRVWDTGNDAFGPTTLQISNIAAGTGAANVIPGTLSVDFNLRFCTQQTSGGLIAEIDELFATAGIDHHLSWTVSGEPFLTTRGKLLGSVISAVEHIQGITPACSTGGGTSDGRFIAPMGCELIELGPVNRTIHQANECVSIPELETLTDIFELSLTKLLGDNG
jgi:succinyl-diaminopimelate desuccinylase